MLDSLMNYVFNTGSTPPKSGSISTGSLSGDVSKLFGAIFSKSPKNSPFAEMVKKSMEEELTATPPPIQKLSGFAQDPRSARSPLNLDATYLRALQTPVSENSLSNIASRGNSSVNRAFQLAYVRTVNPSRLPSASQVGSVNVSAPTAKKSVRTKTRRAYQPNIYSSET